MNLKKPKFWDYRKPNIIAYLLSPIAFLVQIFVFLFRKKNRQKFKIKTICVGNIYIGGTGKTSLSIKLNQILNQKKIKSCFVKKFYKNQIDEQNLLRNNGKLFLSSKRIDAITKAEKENYDVVILDDGLQDKSIEPDINLVCFNNANWIGNGMTIPAGPLREKIDNLKYYEHIFLNGNLENLEKIKEEILKVNSKINIHIGKYEPVNIDEFNKEDKYLVFSGIGNHKTFISMLTNNGIKIIKDIEFSDHHKYKKNEIDKIINEANRLSCKLITTEKDFLRIKDKSKNKIKYIKSELKINDEETLIKSIL
jgi:tetraacyldisaccharide 4'-kinase